MAEQAECAGCGRPRDAVQDRVSQCGFANNRSSERCVWLAMQQPGARPEAGTDATFEQQVEALRQDLTAARAQTAQTVKRLEAESAASIALQEQAVQHKALADEASARHSYLQSEVERLKELLGLVPPAKPTTARGWAQRAITWLVASRATFGSVSAVLGLMLGAGGVGWWQHSGPPAVAIRNVKTILPTLPTLRPVPPEPPASAPTAPVSPSTREATSQVNALILQSRLDQALRQLGLKVTARVEESLNTVSVDVETGNVAQQKRADLIVRSVFAGAGLPDPIIQHAAPHKAVLGFDHASVAPTDAASVAPPDRGGRPDRGMDSATNPPPLQGAAPLTIQPVSLEELCKKKLNLKSWDVTLTWKLSSCMQEKCCQANMLQNQECSSFDRKYPLNCRH